MNFQVLEGLLSDKEGAPLAERHESNGEIALYLREVLSNPYCKNQLKELCSHHDRKFEEYIERIREIIFRLLDMVFDGDKATQFDIDYRNKETEILDQHIRDWITGKNNELQSWVLNNGDIPNWAQGINIIEAAIHVAGEPSA